MRLSKALLRRQLVALSWLGVSCAASMPLSAAPTNNYFTNTGGAALNGNSWNTNPAGPLFDQPLSSDPTDGAIINFGQENLTVTGAAITVAGINATANTTLTTFAGTIVNQANGVIPIDVASGITLDFGTQNFTTAAGAGYIKNGSGTIALAGNTYAGGFTLNAGTVILRGVNGMGDGGLLTINGGTIAASATRDLSAKYDLGIVVGGNFTLGSAAAPADTAANITFSDNMNLGSATRTITQGGTGTYTLGGIISGDSGVGLTFAKTAGAGGSFVLSGANTYSGVTTLQNSVLVTISNSNALGTTAGNTVINNLSSLRLTGGINVAEDITFVGNDQTDTPIKNVSGTNTLSGVLTVATGSTGDHRINNAGGVLNITNAINTGAARLVFQTTGAINVSGIISGSGGIIKSSTGTATVTLTGLNTYTGPTSNSAGVFSINTLKNVGGGASSLGAPTTAANGIINLTGGSVGLTYTGTGDSSDRGINTGTGAGTTTLTQSGSGLFKIGGAIVGNGTAGTSGTRTLALAGATAGTGELSGIISDYSAAVPTAISKLGSGTWTLSGANTYTAATTVSAGLLVVNGSTASASTVSVAAAGSLGGTGTLNGAATIDGLVRPGNSVGTLAFGGGLTLNGTYALETAAGSSSDRLNVTGTLTLGGASILDLTTTLVPTETYVIANYTTRIGTFFNVDTAILATHSIDYVTGNQITLVPLVAIPEPSTLVFGAIAALGFAAIRRRRMAR